MKALFSEIRGAVVSTLALAVVCCGVYPVIVYGVGRLMFADNANGSLIVDQNGTVRGSRLLGQSFVHAKYFHSRPSAAGGGYDAANSGGSNLGPTSQKLHDAIKERIATYRQENDLAADAEVPADAVTASGSGLDPHISLHNARLQAPRVARARMLPVEKVEGLFPAHTQNAAFGLLGVAGVNVVTLNHALDEMKKQ